MEKSISEHFTGDLTRSTRPIVVDIDCTIMVLSFRKYVVGEDGRKIFFMLENGFVKKIPFALYQHDSKSLNFSMLELAHTQYQPTRYFGFGNNSWLQYNVGAKKPLLSSQMRFSTKSSTKCPFSILGLSHPSKDKSVTYNEVKKQFIKLAMLHHPDKLSQSKKDLSEEEKRNATKSFIYYRNAFESIQETPNGGATYIGSGSTGIDGDHRKESEFSSWFQRETGYTVPFSMGDIQATMDPTVLKEVVETTKGMSPGGLDKGGMWELAAHIRYQSEKIDHDTLPLHLSSGGKHTKDNDNNQKTRRRRRK